MSQNNEPTDQEITLHPLERALAYGVHHGDLSGVQEILTLLIEQCPTSSVAHFVSAQITYEKREWTQLVYSLRYVLAYGVRDPWVGGLLATLCMLCDDQSASKYILDLCEAHLFSIDVELSPEELDEVRAALSTPLSPPHLQKKTHFKDRQGQSEGDRVAHDTDVFKSKVFDKQRSRQLPHQPLPDWLESSPLSGARDDQTQGLQTRPEWLEEGRQDSSKKTKIFEGLPSWLSNVWREDEDPQQSESITDALQEQHREQHREQQEQHREQHKPQNELSDQLMAELLTPLLSSDPHDFESLDPLREELELGHQQGFPSPLAIAIKLPPPILNQANQSPRVLNGQFLMALSHDKLFLADLKNAQKPWAFHISEIAKIGLDEKGDLLSFMFKDQRTISFHLTSWPKYKIGSLSSRLGVWLVGALDFDDLL